MSQPSPQGKRKREGSEVGVVHLLRENTTTLGSGEALRGPEQKGSRKN